MAAVRARSIIAAVVGVCLIYAVVRYNVAKGVSLEHLPLYVLNKVAAFGGLVLIGLGALGRFEKCRQMFLAGSVLAGGHILMSSIVLRPGYFAKHFTHDGMLTWQAEVSLLAGVVAAFCLLFAWQPSDQTREHQRRVVLGPVCRASVLSGL